ncbi:ATP-binding protein [Streptomyces aureocirculatus]|uniref:ATP-binding protein n=1 Tax=Streptomyces aureocirculatus TaxID=67275 RepID=UPI0012FF3611|nr:ATP-binding protein [Streptomyces aureocirculatus]
MEISDVRGHVTIGDNNIVVSGDRSYVQVVNAAQRPVPAVREDVTLLPRRPRTAVGRERELEEIVRGLADHDAWQVHGPPGIGKSTLLRLTAHRLADEDRPVLFVDAAGRETGDVLQDVFEACYDAPGYRPAPTELRRLMARVTVDVVLDDLETGAADLDGVLDALPSSVLLCASGRRTLLGRGRALALGGLGHQDALELMSRSLGRPLTAAEEPVAEELWRATAGAPLPLLRAALPDRLRAAAELDGLLPQLLATLSGAERDVVEILAVARDGGVSTRLLTVLLGGVTGLPAVCDRLAARGVVVATEYGHRLAPEIGGRQLTALRAGPPELAALAVRLTQWVSATGTEPSAVAQDAALLTAAIDAAAAAGRPQEAARLARAASPVLACSLRTGAWGRVLERGIEAAERAGLRDIAAYLTHEDGVRKLVTGKRLLAGAAFAAAAAYWRELGSGEDAAAADDAARACGGEPSGAGDPGGGGDTSGAGDTAGAGEPGGAGNPGGPSDDGGTQPDPADSGADSGADALASGGQGSADPGPAADLGHEMTSQLVSSAPPFDPGSMAVATKGGVAAKTGLAAKTGMTMSAKVVIGGGLAASVTAGGVVLSQQADADTVPVRVTVATRVLEATMPGDPEGRCVVKGGATDCTRVVTSKKGESGPVSVDPAQPLPEGVSLVYWGCDEGPQADSCSVTAEGERHVCATTTSPEDEGARRRCAELTDSPAPTVAFRPLAWTTNTHVKVLAEPDGRPQVLASLSGGQRPGQVVWSENATEVAWTEVRTPGAEDFADDTTIKLRDLKTGSERSWTCYSCTIAFVDGELVSGSMDIRHHPADGEEPKNRDLPEIPVGPAHDGPPNTTLLTSWNGSRLRTYAVSRVGTVGERTLLFELDSPTRARQVEELPRLDHAGGVWAVSPDGERAVIDPPTGEPAYNSCGEAGYSMAALDIASGATDPLRGPGAGWRVHETWFDPDGTAHVVYRAEKRATGAATCSVDTSRAPVRYTLAPGAESWKRSVNEPSRIMAVGGGKRVTRTADGGAFKLVVGAGGKQRTLDTGVEGVYPSAAATGRSS